MPLCDGLRQYGLNPDKAEVLEAYAKLVLEKNRVMNLTAVRDPVQFNRLHLLDSAYLASVLDLSGKHVLDVGTGAGLPGIPLKLLQPDIHLTLLDSTAKKVEFLKEVCGKLSISGVDYVSERAEEYARKHRECYDIVVSRAVAAMNVLSELCLPFVRTGGTFCAMKSTGTDEELSEAERAIKTLGGQLYALTDYTIPGTDVKHRCVQIRKIGRTPDSYPRSYVKIKRNPL